MSEPRAEQVKPAAKANSSLPFRDLPRLGRILRVLAEKGWGHWVERLRLKGYLPAGTTEQSPPGLSDAQRLRAALEELGPTFVKFGQMLSVRQDLFPEDVIRELEKLQDAVPPFPGEQARRIIEDELGRPVGGLFAAFDEAPLAAASVAQVHTATLPDGTLAVVKVQRPGIEETIHSDLEILFFFARLIHEHFPENRRYDPIGLVEEFADTIQRELDFRLEGHNAERFAGNFRDEPAVYVPRVFWELTSGRILAMERSPGHRADADYPADPAERRRLAAVLARLFLTQLFEHGFFHGDPHPGNVFIMHDGRICFHDFGIVGRLSRRDQDNLEQLLLAVSARDAEWMAEVYFEMGVAGASVDREAFARDLDEALEQYYAAAARSYSFGEILRQFIRLGQRYEIHVPRELLLVAKAFMEIESQARALAPAFNMITAFQSYVPTLVGRELAPDLSWTGGLAKGYRMAGALRKAAAELPGVLAEGLRQMRKGGAMVRLRHEQLEGLEQRIDRASNRMSFALIIAAILIGSSMLMSFHSGGHLQGIPLLGLIGYLLAGVLGLWWAVAVLRSGKL